MSGISVGVVGASARAAAGSLLRAGFVPWAVDLFADRDLKRIAPTARCPFDRYPHGLPDLCDAFPHGPVIYTGGLENYPDVVRELAARRPLWGNPPEVLERVRDPFQLHAALTAAGLPAPQLLPPDSPVPNDGRWLRKSLHSAGGLGVRTATPGDSGNGYLHEFIDGPSMSAVFVRIGAIAALISVTEQLIGESWLHAGPFRYAGNIAPVSCDPPWGDDLHRLGSVLTTVFGLRGIWGVDFILHAGRAYPVEVNPRYPASMEVIELAHGATLTHMHAAAFGTPTDPRCAPTAELRVVGKAIYFAPHSLTFPDAGPWDADLAGEFDPWRVPGFADIPEPGELIDPGWPVLTFFATGSTPDDVRQRLQSRAAELDHLFARDQRP